jgi:hypothetical protein
MRLSFPRDLIGFVLPNLRLAGEGERDHQLTEARLWRVASKLRSRQHRAPDAYAVEGLVHSSADSRAKRLEPDHLDDLKCFLSPE